MSRQRIFSPSHKKNYAKLYGGGKSHIRSDGPIVIYPGTDSLPNILSSIPDRILNKFQLNDGSIRETFHNWTKMSNEVFERSDSISTEEEGIYQYEKSDFFNAEIDIVRSQVLERNRKLMARMR